MISAFLWNVALGKQAEFIIDFLIKTKKVNVFARYFLCVSRTISKSYLLFIA